MNILFSPEITAAAPGLQVLEVTADISNPPTSDDLYNAITEAGERIALSTPMERVRHRTAIDATRNAYRALGKDPNRYRPSAEALCRRMVKGAGLYRTLAAIDAINLMSLLSGHSIGGFDAEAVSGDTLTLGVGQEGEPYEAIGRGMLNIAGLPVFRDAIGGIGTPTSDNERTKLSPGTTHLLMTVNIYGPSEDYPTPADVETMVRDIITRHLDAKNIRTRLWTPS